MKKTFFLVALLATVSTSSLFAQDSTSQAAGLLTHYYAIKDALVAGNGSTASANAALFIQSLNKLTNGAIADDSKTALLKDAAPIAASSDIKKQRESFASLSTNLATLAKTVKLSTEPVYMQYCPMKKWSWLSSDKAIKNPYYGSAMLTCGKVTETINP